MLYLQVIFVKTIYGTEALELDRTTSMSKFVLPYLLDKVVVDVKFHPNSVKRAGHSLLLSRLQGSTTIFNSFREALLVFLNK